MPVLKGCVMRRMVLAVLLLWPVMATAAERNQGRITMVVEFAIRDYAAWRPVFDAAEPEREKAGVSTSRVFRDVDRPDQMLALFKVATRAKGDAWMKSAAVREAWKKGGVIGEVTHRFLR